MDDGRLTNIGVLTAVIGGVVLVLSAILMVYPELENGTPGDRELTHPYAIEGSYVFLIGIVVMTAGLTLATIGKRMEAQT